MKFPFKCPACGANFDIEAPIGHPPPPPNCLCGNAVLRRVFLPLPDHWRTSGVYKTDKALYGTTPGDYERNDSLN